MRATILRGSQHPSKTNPLDFSTFTPLQLDAGSAAQEVAPAAPDAKVVKAFNTTFAGTLVEGNVSGQPLDRRGLRVGGQGRRLSGRGRFRRPLLAAWEP